MKKIRLRKEMARRLKVMFCFLIVGAILIQFSNSEYILANAQDDVIATYLIGAEGDNIQAVLTKDGTITLEGTGDTKDYAPDSMPFTDNIERITNVEVEDGITGLGDYLFFGCMNLNDKLKLPSTLTSIGDYAFSGYTKETAPAFTYITNDFKSADISVPVSVEEKTEENTAKDTAEVDSTEKDTEASDITSENGEQATETTDKDESKKVEKSSEETKEVEQKMEVKTITEQEIGTDIFYAGQTGGYKANAENKTFRESAEAASYIEADRFVTVSLDGVITQHLPVKDGKLIIPDLPNFGIVSPKADDAYTTHTFSGWSLNEKTYLPKDKYEINDSKDSITLTSNWNEQWSITPQVKTEAKEDVTVYSVIDQSTQKEINKAEGYVLSVQWQINKKDKDEESAWENIKDATSLSYERKVQSGDTSSFFRANITILRESKLRVATEPKILTTDPVNGMNSLTPITVTYNAGNGATGSIASKDLKEGENYKLEENTFTRIDGKVFTGWKVTLIGVIATKNDGTVINSGDIIQSYDTISAKLENTATGNISLQAQWAGTKKVYLGGAKANDTNTGLSENSPVATISKAYELLDTNNTMETNIIVLLGDISLSSQTLPSKNVTITTQSNVNQPKIAMTGNYRLYLSGDTKFENITISTSSPDWAAGYGIFANGNVLVMGNNITVINGKLSVFGGSYDQVLSKNTNIYIYSGIYSGVGGASFRSNLNGNTNISVFGGSVDRMYGGSMNNTGNANTISGSTHISVYNGKIEFTHGCSRYGTVAGGTNDYSSKVNLYGGDFSASVNAAPHADGGHGGIAVKKTTLNIYGGVVGGTTEETDSVPYGSVFGGGFDLNNSSSISTCQGGTEINIYGGTIFSNVAGGAFGYWGSSQSKAGVSGGSKINIYGGEIKKNVYGCGMLEAVDGGVIINILGGTIGGDVYIAGKGGTTSSGRLAYGNLGGNGVITIGSNAIIKGNVYGGSQSYGTVSGNSTINIKEANIDKNIYGGGFGKDTKVTGNSTINVSENSSIHGNIFGGGELGQIQSSSLNINDSKINGSIFGGGNNVGVSTSNIIINGSTNVDGNIYGGSNSLGTTITSNVTIQSDIANNVYAGGKGSDTSVTNANLNIYNGANIQANAYGGAEEGTVTNSKVQLNGGYVKNVFGGSNKANVTDSVSITSLTGSSAGNIFAGCNAFGSVKNPTLNLSGAATNVFGGGNATGSSAADVVGQTTINISSNESNKITNVYGGANTTGLVTSSIVNIKGYVENVYGGGEGAETIANTPTVNIEAGANVSGNVFGGGNLGKVATPTINLNGGTVKNAFAGGNAIGVTGTVKLNSNNGSTATNIYGGSNLSGTVTNPVLEIHGNVTNVYGGGYEGGTNDGSTTGTIVDSPTINVKEGTIKNVYGGGEKGPTVNTNTIMITGSDISNVFGGGKSAAADNAVISLNNSTNAISSVENIYGGSESTGLVKSSHIEVNGTVNSVFGGGKGSQTIVKETYIKTEANSKANYVYGGSEEGKVVDATIVVMGPVEESVYGGGYGKTSVVTENTWVYVANDVKDSIYGGGNQGSVEGNTHVDVASGTIGSTGKEGNVFGGSNQAKVDGDTLVHIGSFVVTTPDGAVLPTTKKLSISGTVFGGGNTTLGGKDFDAGDPYVLGNASVHIGGTDYSELKIGKSIFGDGNKCVVNGDKTIEIVDYNALGDNANKSIQRATTLTITGSQIESIGETDSANLVQTTSYSLNRIDNLIIKGGSTLKLQNGVNLVMGFESQNVDGTHQTKAQASNDTTGNKIYVQQGQHIEFRVNEDVSRPGYGDVKGFTQLGRYYIDGKAIDSSAEGVYIMGSYYTADTSNNNISGFTVAESEKFDGQDEIKKGDVIEATTNSTSWRNWNLGSQAKASNKTLTISDNPGSGKTAQITETWVADGAIYRIDPSSLQISGNSNYTVVNPDNITSSSNENTIGLSIETGQTGWLEQIKAGYVDSKLGKIVPYSTAKAEGDSLDMRSISNDQISPIINVKLYNADNITASDTNPLTVTFTINRIAEQADGSEIKTGSISVTLSITKTKTTSYASTLIGQGKAYDRAIQEYNYDTASGVGTSVSKSSSITAQFSEKTESAKTISSQEINFSAGKSSTTLTLPAGTSIMMVDRSGVTPVYYHYEVTSNTSAVQLTDFVKNGSSEKYKNPGSVARSNFIFILDFEGAQSFSNSDICMTLKTAYSTGSPSEKKVRFAVTGDKRTYEMSSGQDNSSSTSVPSYRMNGTFGLSLTTNVSNTSSAGADTTGSDRQMAAKVQLKLTNTSTGTVIPIPSGWQIQSNGTRYSTTGDSATILLANSLTAAQSDIYVIMSNMGDISAGNYKLEISLVAGAMANYPSETLSSNTVTYKFKLTDDRYSIKSNIQDESKQVIKKSSTDKSMKYDVIRVSNGSSSTTNIATKATLWKKDERGSYQQVDLASKVEKVDGGTFDKTNNKVTMPWGTFKTIGFILKSDIDAGTYQWRYEIIQAVENVENILATEKNSFIITED